jgi:hypothetical protein
MSKAFMRACAQCEHDIPHDQVTSWGKTSWIDKICKTNYNRQTERCKNNPNLKTWWKNLSKEERVQWFRSNKATYEPGGMKAFDNAGFVEEEVSDVARSTDDLIVRYMTLEDWTIREKQLGHCGDGGHEEQNDVAKKSFMAKVMDKKAMTKFKNGMWLVAVFLGGEVRIGKEHAHKFHQKRKRTINDAMDYEAAGAMKKAATDTSSAFLATAMEAALEGIDDGAGREVNIPEGLARNPAVKVSNNDEFGEDIHRDVLMAMQRNAKMAAQEEMDDHEAEQARRIERGNAAGIRGRPHKCRSELLSDISKMKRDRCTHISDAMLAVRATMASVELDAEQKLGKPLPDDVTRVLAQMKLDCKDSLAEMDRIRTELEATSVDSFVGEKECKLDEVKKSLIDKTKPAFAKHQQMANKAIKAFKTAARKAAAKSGKKRKGEKEGAQIPPVVQKLLDVAEKCPADRFGVKEPASVDEVVGQVLLMEPYFAQVLAAKDGLSKVKGMHPTVKWLTGQVDKSGGTLSYAMASHKPAVNKQVTAVLQDKCPQLLSKDFMLPAEFKTLSEDICGPQHWVAAETHMNAGLTPYGLPEVRLLISGSYLCAGVRFEDVTPTKGGNSIKAKLEHCLTEQGFNRFLEDAKTNEDKGFWFVHDEEYSCVKIPAGYIVFTCGMHSTDKEAVGSHGLRWSTLDVADHGAVASAKTCLAHTLATYPELKDDEYSAWEDCLRKYIVPLP